MATQQQSGRWAGGVYLVVIATGIFSLAYVPSQISVAGDPAATLANIATHAGLFRAGIAAFALEQIAFLLLPLLLYRLFAPSYRTAATLMVALAVAGVPIALAALAQRLDAVALLTDPVLARTLAPDQLQALAIAALKSWSSHIFLASLFWGLWLLPFGWLVWRTRAIPRALGVLLMLGGVGYLLNVFGELLIPGYATTLLSNYATLPASLGEIGSGLWLLLFGARRDAGSAPSRGVPR
ncbi:DUF4386 domain-containing protein [Stenotrophomonas sp. LGBM10]|uniref:DUF4386 domain-containing protein n=1 Tax=Stenotrophomonas sp. LGBM10 TaxID=3390038 RepID=UPI00398B9E9B